MLDNAHTKKAPGRPSSLTKIEEQRYVTLRNWNFSQREAGALARKLPRGRNGVRLHLSASVCQRLDKLHGPFAETLKLPSGHSEDSLRKLPERALVALADARGDVNNHKYQEAVGLRTVGKEASAYGRGATRASHTACRTSRGIHHVSGMAPCQFSTQCVLHGSVEHGGQALCTREGVVH